MIEASAQVVAVAGGRMTVRVSERPGGCGRCDEPGGCRSIRLTNALGEPNMEFELENRISAQVGQRVLIGIEDGAPLRGALASYGLATLLLLLGAVVGQTVGGSDLAALAGGVVGLAAAVLINRGLHRSRRWRHSFGLQVLGLDRGCAGRAGEVR